MLFLSPASVALARSPEKVVPATPGLDAAVEGLLETSPYVYVSPIKSDGAESACHGEVWFGWFDGSAVIITGADRWKARAVKQGLDTARLWVGDYGRWKKLVGRNEAFRAGPSFDARASFSTDESLLERMIASYEAKYPAEIGAWRDKFRNGFRDGSRVLIRYTPLT